MSIAQLLCEGKNHSPDIRVLSKILAGTCEVKPYESKYGMGDKILIHRKTVNHDGIFGILDGDFISVWRPPLNSPKKWISSDNKIHFGWRWERKEIENYLIDPVVVEMALGKNGFRKNNITIEHFKKALFCVKNKIATYEATRMTLSAHRKRLVPISSSFGKKRGKEKHRFPEDFSKDYCLRQLKN